MMRTLAIAAVLVGLTAAGLAAAVIASVVTGEYPDYG
jgi:hypothetical protein